MYDFPFFTAIDPDARIKGSRDPLGFEVIWTALGREIIGNLTTVTRSVRQFSTLLFGFHLANRATESLADRDEQFLPAFLRFEQLAAYARFCQYGDQTVGGDIRGIRAVRRNMQESRHHLRLSPEPQWRLLSDQKTYGLYGLFRMAAYNSGLLDRDKDTQLSPRAREFVEQRLRSVPRNTQEQIVRSIRQDTAFDADKSSAVDAVAGLLEPQLSGSEIPFYGSHLVRGQYLLEALEDQARLWECIEAVNSPSRKFSWDVEFDMKELGACIGDATARGYGELAGTLDRIRRTEELLGTAAQLYDFLLTQANQPLDTVAGTMSRQFDQGLNWLRVADLKPTFGESGERLAGLAERLASGDYAGACKALLAQNDAVMRQRDGRAWIVLKDGTLDVRLIEEGGNLPTHEDLRHPWVHTYFLNALKRVGACVYHGVAGGDDDAAQ